MMCTVPQIRKEQIDQQHSCKAFALAGKKLLFFSNSRTVKRILIFLFQMTMLGRILRGLILVSVWTVEGK